jgi:branched-chain amino acid aminotransferase
VEKLRLSLPVDREELRGILMECVRRAGLKDAYVEMVCTRGFSPTFSRDPRDAVNNFFAFAIPFTSVANEEQRARGLDIAVSQVHRIPPDSVDPTVKNYHWLDLVAGLFEAYDRGSENVILTDLGALTPDQGVLQGITRKTAVELCAEIGLQVTTAPLPVARLRGAEEIFITSTAGGIMPVTRIDGAPIGDGRPGPVTRRLAALYWDKHQDPAWTTAVDYGG